MLRPSSRVFLLTGAFVLLGACQGEGLSAPAGPGPGPELAAARDSILSLTNAARAEEGMAPLTADAALDAVAQAHAEDMVARGYFSHTSPDGDAPWDRVQRAGLGYTFIGENIAINASAGAAVDAWMNSAGHRANILREGFGHIGIGVAGSHYVQLFAE